MLGSTQICSWLSEAVSAQGVHGSSFSPAPGCWRAEDPLSPLIRLGCGVVVGSGGSLGCPSHTEESLTSFVPEVKFFFLVKHWNRPFLEVFKKTSGL